MRKKGDKTNSTGKSLVPSVEQASRILIYLAGNSSRKATLTEIAKNIGIHKSKGYSILLTLMHFGFVTKDLASMTYSLGPNLLFLSRSVLDNLDVREVVRPFLKKLAEGTMSTAVFGLINGKRVFVISKEESSENIGITLRLGQTFHITSGAHGKALVAFMSENERKEILSGEQLYFYGKMGHIDFQSLKSELSDCRKKGFARDFGELEQGVNALSAPVFGPNNLLLGCVILVGTFLERNAEKFGRHVADTGRVISKNLGADVDLVYGPFKGGLSSL